MTSDLEALCQIPMARQQQWSQQLNQAQSQEEKLKTLMKIGREAPQLPRSEWTPENRVVGCQSEMYLGVVLEQNQMRLSIGSDALISAGLAALVVSVFDGCTPVQCLRCPFLLPEWIGLSQMLTPGRMNGLLSLVQTLRARALSLLTVPRAP